MSKMVDGKWSGWTLLIAYVVLALAMFLSSGAEKKAQASPNRRTSAAKVSSGSEVTPGIARAEKDRLDLQLD